jgi:hypothetical protein
MANSFHRDIISPPPVSTNPGPPQTNVDPRLLEIDEVYPRSFEEDFAARDPELDYMTEAGKALVPWFATCWHAAGGPAFPRPSYIGLHDDSTRYDLVSGRWV